MLQVGETSEDEQERMEQPKRRQWHKAQTLARHVFTTAQTRLADFQEPEEKQKELDKREVVRN